ncbi:hypothetical protein N8274_05190 [Flavobacteriaceae bacterium]|nr:hypothetical protein [Flavobacteriaceae bacterium]
MKNKILAMALLVSTLLSAQAYERNDIDLLEGKRFNVIYRQTWTVTPNKETGWSSQARKGEESSDMYFVVRSGSLHQTNKYNTSSNPAYFFPRENLYWAPKRGNEFIVIIWENHKGEDSYVRHEYTAKLIK